MAKRSGTVLVASFAGSFLVVGLTYWQIPYVQVSLPDAVWGAPLIFVVVSAALPCILSATRFWLSTLIVGSSVPAAVLARVMYEAFLDPTSHNLWPFEIILSAGPGLIAALVGALAGKLLARRGSA